MKKKELPSLPLFTDKFLAETLHINICETGIYIKLLCWYWTKKRGVTKDEAFKIVNDDKYNKSTEYVLKEFFVFNKDNSRYEHKRLEQEHDYLKDYYLNKATSGRIGGLKSSFSTYSKQTASKMQPPISIPISIPNNINKTKLNEKPFHIFWEALRAKKGSKHKSMKLYDSLCADLNPIEVANIFNNMASKIKDKQFIPYVATWLNQRRFEDEEDKPKTYIEPIYEFKGIKLKKMGEFGEFIELKDDKGNKYHKHKFRNIPIEKI